MEACCWVEKVMKVEADTRSKRQMEERQRLGTDRLKQVQSREGRQKKEVNETGAVGGGHNAGERWNARMWRHD